MMKKTFNNKRVRIIVRLCAIIFFIFTVIFTNLSLDQHKASAETTNQGNEKTAQQKLYAQALLKCTEHLEVNIGSSDLSHIRADDGKKSFFVGGYYAYGVAIEQHFKGTTTDWQDGKLNCNHKGGKLASNSTLSAFEMGFSQEELFCNGSGPGIYASEDKSAAGCAAIYRGETNAKKLDPADGRSDYIKSLVAEKTFGGDVPGGSVGSFTDLEKYYVYKDAFFSVCATKTGEKDSSLLYQVKTWDSATNDFVTLGYTQKDKDIEPDQKFYVTLSEKMSCNELAAKLNSGKEFTAYSTTKKAAAAHPGTTEDPDDPGGVLSPGSSSTTSDPTCLTEEGSLSWIACPAGDSMSSFLSGVYEDIIEDKFLNLKPELFNGNSGTREAWSVFQTIANIMFIILLLIVVFSQLTGVGIDNYGIKKILPKLIITVLLINLSYIICQALVDFSNIVGTSSKDMLDSIATNSVGGTYAGIKDGFKAIIGVLAGTIGLAGGATVAVTLFTSGWAAFLPLLLALLSAVISLVFFLILLGIRQAGVVILVALAPLAFACYALPNTKKLFDKWLKVFKALLVVYPICGLLMGGGSLASSIILKDVSSDFSEGDLGTFFLLITGLAIRVVPIFAVPSLVKGAFAAMGNIGAKISGVGKNLGSRATGSIRKSEGYQSARTSLAAGKPNGIRSKIGQAAGKSGIGRALVGNRYARNQMAALEQQRKQGNLAKMTDADYVASQKAAIEDKQRDEDVNSTLSLMRSNGITMDNGQVAAYDIGNMQKRLIELSSKDTSNYSKEQLSRYRREVAALSRGLSQETGGGSKLAEVIRHESTLSDGSANQGFLEVMGDIYSKDSTVKSKLNAKDTGASYYVEQFTAGGKYRAKRDKNGSIISAPSSENFGNFKETKEYKEVTRVGKNCRIKDHAAGVDQSAEARAEYMDSMSQNDFKDLANSKSFENLDSDSRSAAINYYNKRGVDGSEGSRTDLSGEFNDLRVLNVRNVPPPSTS